MVILGQLSTVISKFSDERHCQGPQTNTSKQDCTDLQDSLLQRWGQRK